jgi:hypothetical protein
MALVSISQAAKLAGITRSNFYTSYLNQGKISVVRDERNRPCVDTSELLRVFGSLKSEGLGIQQDTTPSYTLGQNTTDSGLYPLVEQLKQQLAESKEREQQALEREQFYQQQLKELTQTIKLLEYKPEPPPRRGWQWWW